MNERLTDVAAFMRGGGKTRIGFVCKKPRGSGFWAWNSFACFVAETEKKEPTRRAKERRKYLFHVSGAVVVFFHTSLFPPPKKKSFSGSRKSASSIEQVRGGRDD